MSRCWLLLAALAGCHLEALEHINSVYVAPGTRYSVESNWRHSRVGNLWPIQGADSAERGGLNAGVVEYVFGAADSPIARYYDLVLAMPDRPGIVDDDLAQLRPDVDAGARATGSAYARVLGRRLAAPINVALGGAGHQYSGTAGILWGIPVDLDAGVPLVSYEREGIRTMQTTLLRYESVSLLYMDSSATQDVLVWDLSEVPGAFEAGPALDQATVAAHIVALHPRKP